MHPEWQAFLISRNANIENSGVTRFTSSNYQKNYSNINFLCDLSHYGLIQATGTDCSSFLQGQFSNDLTQINDSQCQISSYSTPKGRMLAIFRVFLRDGCYYLHMPAELIAPVLKRLQMFVMRADVKLHDASNELVRFGLSGPDSINLIEQNLGVQPGKVDECVQTDSVTVIRVPGINPRFEIVGPADKLILLWEQFERSSTPAGADLWSLFEIKSGLPTVYPQTSEAFVPQMANLDLVNGVSFKKGCFPGQEIIARMHYLGTLKRRMYLLHSDSDTLPAPGDSLFSVNDNPEQPSGVFVDAQPDPQGGIAALAVIKIEQATSGNLHYKDLAGPEFKINALPYDISTSS